MAADEYNYMLEVIAKVQKTLDRLEGNWDRDRRDFSDFAVRLGNLEVIVKELKEQIFKMPQKTSDKVENALAPMLEETQDLKDTIDQKKVLNLKPTRSKPWWKFW